MLYTAFIFLEMTYSFLVRKEVGRGWALILICPYMRLLCEVNNQQNSPDFVDVYPFCHLWLYKASFRFAFKAEKPVEQLLAEAEAKHT